MNTQTSRRSFMEVAGIGLAAAWLNAYQRRPAEGRLFAYVGRHTVGPFFGSNKGGGVNVFRVNMADGSLTEVSKTGPEVEDLNSDGMCTSADGRFLYSINLTPALGGKAGAGGGVAAFAINHEDGSLKHLNTQPSMGSMPTSVIIDKTNSRAVVANHGALNRVVLITKRGGVPVIGSPTDDATVALFPVRPDGSLEPACDVSFLIDRLLRKPPVRARACKRAPRVTPRFSTRLSAGSLPRTTGWTVFTFIRSGPTRASSKGNRFRRHPGKRRGISLHIRARRISS